MKQIFHMYIHKWLIVVSICNLFHLRYPITIYHNFTEFSHLFLKTRRKRVKRLHSGTTSDKSILKFYQSTPKLRYNESWYSEFCEIVNKCQLPLLLTKSRYSEFCDIVNKKSLTQSFVILKFGCMYLTKKYLAQKGNQITKIISKV